VAQRRARLTVPVLLRASHQSVRSVVPPRTHADHVLGGSRLMHAGFENGQRWADIVDFLTMCPEARRSVVRLLGEIGAR